MFQTIMSSNVCVFAFVCCFQNIPIDACVLEKDSGLLQQVQLLTVKNFFVCEVCVIFSTPLKVCPFHPAMQH